MNFVAFFDLDSTVCDTGHRQGMIDRVNGTDWRAYSMACSDDEPVEGVVTLVRMFHALGVITIALSGRDAAARKQTYAWLARHDVPFDEVWLREDADGEIPNEQLKARKIREYTQNATSPADFVVMVDDWPPVKDALAEIGVPTVIVNTPQALEMFHERRTEEHVSPSLPTIIS